MQPTEAEISEYQARSAVRTSARQRRAGAIKPVVMLVLSLVALSVGGAVLDALLATFYTPDGQSGATITSGDMLSGTPLVGVLIYAAAVVALWLIWHQPAVKKRRALRRAVRARLAARIGDEHPFRQFAALHPYGAHFLRIMLVFEVLQVIFGRVTPRRR